MLETRGGGGAATNSRLSQQCPGMFSVPPPPPLTYNLIPRPCAKTPLLTPLE